MALAYTRRSWLAPGGWDGPRWSADQVRRFERVMKRHARKRRGMPAMVSSWDAGGSAMCWYTARCGREERALYAQCVAIFGKPSQRDWSELRSEMSGSE